MLHAYLGAIKTYFKALDVVLLFSLILLISLAFPMLFPDYFFWTFSGIFLRISKLTDINLSELIISIFLYISSILLFSLAFLLITQIVKEYRSDTIRVEILKEVVRKQYPEIASFFILFFMLIFSLGIFGYILALPSWLITLSFYIIGYMLFFIPFAVAIDEYKIEEAFKQLWKYKHRLFHYPFIYSITIGTLIVVVALILILLTKNLELTRIISNIINALVIVPFGIILGAHFYFDKYTLSIREI